MKKLILTGGTGFIGRHCLKILSEDASFDVHATYNTSKPIAYDGVSWYKANLHQKDEVEDLVSQIKPEYLLHLAWYAVPGKFWSADENFIWVSSSLSLISAFAEHGGQRLVCSGSCAEYDWRYGFLSEDTTPCNPNTVYGICKHSLQLMTNAYSLRAKMSSAWGRVFFLYGPHESKQKLVAYVIDTLIRNKNAACSDGEQIRDFLHVEDVARAFIHLLKSDVVGPVNICSGDPIALKEIIWQIATILDGHDKIALGAIATDKDEPKILVGNNSKMTNQTGWKPKYNIRNGLESAVNWWIDQANQSRNQSK